MPGRLAHYAQLAVRPQPRGREDRMAGFLFRLETVEGEPAEPPTLSAAVPNWKPGDTIALGKRMLRVVALRDVDGDAPPLLVVEDVASQARGAGTRNSWCFPRCASPQPVTWSEGEPGRPRPPRSSRGLNANGHPAGLTEASGTRGRHSPLPVVRPAALSRGLSREVTERTRGRSSSPARTIRTVFCARLQRTPDRRGRDLTTASG